jgi:hypothetical protein
MRSAFWALVVLALLALGGGASAASGKAAAGPITEITLDHSPGMPAPGQPWPFYKVTFHRSGAVEYNGPHGDYYKGKISRADFDRLAQALIKMGYQRLQRYYPLVPDSESDELSVVRGGVRKDVTYGDSDAGTASLAEHAAFQKLLAFEPQVKAVLKHIHLTKIHPEKKR